MAALMIPLTNKIIEAIKRARTEKRLSQQAVSTMSAGIINANRLAKIETYRRKKISKDEFEALCSILEITPSSIYSPEKSIKVSWRIESKTLGQLESYATVNHMTASEAIRYILDDYFTNANILSVKYDLQNVFEDALKNTVERILREEQTKQMILKKALETVSKRHGENAEEVLDEIKHEAIINKRRKVFRD